MVDYELFTPFRNRNITNSYQFRDEVVRQTLTMAPANKLEREAPDMQFREYSLLFLRAIGKSYEAILMKILDGEGGGGDDTYDHNRKCRAKESTMTTEKKRFGQNITKRQSIRF